LRPVDVVKSIIVNAYIVRNGSTFVVYPYDGRRHPVLSRFSRGSKYIVVDPDIIVYSLIQVGNDGGSDDVLECIPSKNVGILLGTVTGCTPCPCKSRSVDPPVLSSRLYSNRNPTSLSTQPVPW
jgi:hypothetical protein